MTKLFCLIALWTVASGYAEESLSPLGFRPVDLDSQVTVPGSPSYPYYCRSEQFPPTADRGRLDQKVHHIPPTGTVGVDFANARKFQPLLSGLFFATRDLERTFSGVQGSSLSTDAGGRVPDKMVQELEPQLWTVGATNIDIALSFGATAATFLGQKYPTPPWDNYEQWKQFVRAQVGAHPKNAVRPTQFGKGVLWLVWNEPDCQYEWSFQKFSLKKSDDNAKNNTFRTLFETYYHAYRAIRELKDGDKEIVAGIAWNQYDRDVIGTFMEFCLDPRHPCEINIMDWHELAQSSNNLPLIQEHIEDFKRTFLNRKDKRYEKLKIRSIMINETVSKQFEGNKGGQSCKPKSNHYDDDQNCYYPPGEVLATKYFGEKGGADRLSVTNFLTATPDGSFGARLDSETQIPLGFWWAEKFYADLGTTRIPCNSDNQQIVCFATPASAKEKIPQILITYYGPTKLLSDGSGERPDLKPITLTLQLENVWGPEIEKAAAKLEIISSIDATPLPEIPMSPPIPLKRHGKKWTVTLPPITLDQVMRVTPVPRWE